MKRKYTWDGQTAAVVGLGVSGISAVQALSRAGCRVIVNDSRDPEQMQAVMKSLYESLGGDPSAAVEDAVFSSHPVGLAKRVSFFVASPGVPLEIPMLQEARRLGVPVIGELELAYRLSQARFIAVTGTKGKSTVTTLLGAMLDGAAPGRVHVGGNIGVPLSSEAFLHSADDWAVVEASSFQLERAADFRPSPALVLNISRDHLDRHGTMKAYAEAKRRIARNHGADDVLVLNADDSAVLRFAEGAPSRILRFSLEPLTGPGAFIQQGELRLRLNGRTESICSVEEAPGPGRHMLSNSLAAICAAGYLEAPVSKMRAALGAFQGLAHAYEHARTLNGVRYIDDSKSTNMASVLAALEAEPSSAPRVCLIMGGVDKGNDYALLTDALRRRVRCLILLGRETDRMRGAYAGLVPLSQAFSMEEAVAQAGAAAEAGDIVLLSPGHASFDMYSDWKERGDAFKRAVQRLD